MCKLIFDLLYLIDQGIMLPAGRMLPVPECIDDRYQWLYTQAPYSLLAHDNSDDPKFIYANQQALRCFKYTKEEMIGLPSRFSAAEEDRLARQELLMTVKEKGIASHYIGPRVDKFGKTFTIYDGIVWQIYNEKNDIVGQAALFWPDDVERSDWFTVKNP